MKYIAEKPEIERVKECYESKSETERVRKSGGDMTSKMIVGTHITTGHGQDDDEDV